MSQSTDACFRRVRCRLVLVHSCLENHVIHDAPIDADAMCALLGEALQDVEGMFWGGQAAQLEPGVSHERH